jgi:hypothetical protein
MENAGDRGVRDVIFQLIRGYMREHSGSLPKQVRVNEATWELVKAEYRDNWKGTRNAHKDAGVFVGGCEVVLDDVLEPGEDVFLVPEHGLQH